MNIDPKGSCGFVEGELDGEIGGFGCLRANIFQIRLSGLRDPGEHAKSYYLPYRVGAFVAM